MGHFNFPQDFDINSRVTLVGEIKLDVSFCALSPNRLVYTSSFVAINTWHKWVGDTSSWKWTTMTFLPLGLSLDQIQVPPQDTKL
jgi:hypothetical protein